MKFVVRIVAETEAGERRTDHKVFGRRQDAENRWYLAWDIMEGRRSVPRGEIVGCALYQADTDDVRVAVEMVKSGTATIIRSDADPYPDIEVDMEWLTSLLES